MEWDGRTREDRHQPPGLARTHYEARLRLADAAHAYDWPGVLAVLAGFSDLVNSVRPGSRSLYAPLHQVAHGGGPDDVVARLVALGAWRTLRDAHGDRPLDVARVAGKTHLLGALEPVLRRHVPRETLVRIEARLHALVRARAGELGVSVDAEGLRLPQLEPLLERDDVTMWFPVPGMYGGFRLRLEATARARLVVESWSRVVGGSEREHALTEDATVTLAAGPRP